MNKACFICGKSHVKFLVKKDGYKLWHCKKCGLNFVHPQPTEKELSAIYSLAGGYSHSSKGFDKGPVSGEPLERINFFINGGKRRVLDVGCASGAFVYQMKKIGLDPIGIDLDPDSIKFGIKGGLDLRHGKLEDMGFKSSSFDAINLGDIIEHVKDPKSFLKECLRILKSKGVLVISTPNTNSLFPKITKILYERFGIMWSHSTPPYHLFDFSDENIVLLLKENDLEIKSISYSKIPLGYSVYHTGYFDKLRKNMGGIGKKDILKGLIKSIDMKIFKQMWTVFLYGICCVVDRLFERNGDQMVVYAVKNK